MDGELEFPANPDLERADDRDVKTDAVQDGAFEGRSVGASRYRMERRSSYCAETAWVWQRARFVCSLPQ